MANCRLACRDSKVVHIGRAGEISVGQGGHRCDLLSILEYQYDMDILLSSLFRPTQC